METVSYLLDQVNGWLQVQSEVDKFPLNSLSLVFLLFQNEHLEMKYSVNYPGGRALLSLTVWLKSC